MIKAYRDRRKQQLTAEQYEAEVKTINSQYSRVFSTQDGQAVLEHLVKTNLAVPIAQKGSDLLDIGVMQGRANLVNEIIQRMELSRNS